MLRERRSNRPLLAVLASLAAAVLVMLGAVAVTSGTASADTQCPPPSVSNGLGGCVTKIGVSSSAPGSTTGGGGGGGGSTGCYFDDAGLIPIPCQAPAPYSGYWDESISCWVALANPQPPASDPSWVGHLPGDGAIWLLTCPRDMPTDWTAFVHVYTQWFANPPAGPSPSALALQAEAEMTLNPPPISLAPNNGAPALVGLPVWFWTSDTPDTWGPQTKTVTAGGLSVTLTAQVQYIQWNTGDGHSFQCATPGTAYTSADGSASSPTCGYTYTQPSGNQPGKAYAVTATSKWTFTWTASDGQTDQLPPDYTQSPTTFLQVGETQVLTQ